MNFQVKTIRPAPYQGVFDAMRSFTEARVVDTPDEIWLCEHPPVYTLGLAGKPEHVLVPHDIPVIQTNRGGQVTYHGPGQVVAYVLMDMRRKNYFVRDYVRRLEDAVIATLAAYDVHGFLVPGAPGVYVHDQAQETRANGAKDEMGGDVGGGIGDNIGDKAAHLPLPQGDPKNPDFTGLAKISALGVKVSQHCTYHGIALNVKMDLRPFEWINPCGYVNLKTTDLFTMGVPIDEHSWEQVAQKLAEQLAITL